MAGVMRSAERPFPKQLRRPWQPGEDRLYTLNPPLIAG